MKINIDKSTKLVISAGDIVVNDLSRMYLVVEDIEEDEYPIKMVNIETGYIDNAYPSYEALILEGSLVKSIPSSRLQLSEI